MNPSPDYSRRQQADSDRVTAVFFANAVLTLRRVRSSESSCYDGASHLLLAGAARVQSVPGGERACGARGGGTVDTPVVILRPQLLKGTSRDVLSQRYIPRCVKLHRASELPEVGWVCLFVLRRICIFNYYVFEYTQKWKHATSNPA